MRVSAFDQTIVISNSSGLANSFAVTKQGDIFAWGGGAIKTTTVRGKYTTDYSEKIIPLHGEQIIFASVSYTEETGNILVVTKTGVVKPNNHTTLCTHANIEEYNMR